MHKVKCCVCVAAHVIRETAAKTRLIYDWIQVLISHPYREEKGKKEKNEKERKKKMRKKERKKTRKKESERKRKKQRERERKKSRKL